MHSLELCIAVQLCLSFGVAGLFWPEKLKPVFEVLMFPWPASYSSIRANCLVAIALSILLFVRLLLAVV